MAAQVSDLDDQINITLFEWAWTVQSLVRLGWTFGEINYGERRLGRRPFIVLTKGDRKVEISHEGQAIDLLRKERGDP
jgi:hypothetical protein